MARYDDGWPAYVPVAERRRKAEREAERLRKRGHAIASVRIEGRAIATTVWGKAWCDNLESYRDYESRLPRGRTYVRNGAVIDLQIGPREVKALVSGSSIYKVRIEIASVPATQWRSICADCAGRIDSLVELLQGRLSKGVMERICRQGTGLFPKPSDVRFFCSCLDFASMCKHAAAVLYGVGARLDRSPELLFRMRAVDENELLAGLDNAMPISTLPGERVLAGDDVAALFGLDMAGSDGTDAKTGGNLSHPPPVSDATALLPQKQTGGRSRPTPLETMSPATASVPKTASARTANVEAAVSKKASRPPPGPVAAKGAWLSVPTAAPGAPTKASTAAIKSIAARLAGPGGLEKEPSAAASRAASLPGIERYAAMAPRPKTPAASAKRASQAPARRRSSTTVAAPEEAAPHLEEPSAPPVRRGGAAGKSTPVDYATSAEGAAKGQPATAQDAARSRTSRRARVPVGSSAAVPPITSTRHAAPHLGSGPAPNALMARLDAIAQGLAELPELRAEVRALGGRVEQLAAVMASQDRAEIEVKISSPPEREASPARARRRERSSGPASSLGAQTSTDASEVEGGAEDPSGLDRDLGDAVPPGVTVQSPARLTGKDEAALHKLEELPKRRGRGRRGE